MNVHNEIEVCSDCVQLIANGEMPVDNTGAQDDAMLAAIQSNWGELAVNICLGDTEEYNEFSWSACDCCDSRLGGARYPAVVLCDHADCVS